MYRYLLVSLRVEMLSGSQIRASLCSGHPRTFVILATECRRVTNYRTDLVQS